MKTLTLNYLLLILAWGLYLDHHFEVSCLILMVGIIYMMKERDKFNYKRLVICFVSSFLALDILYGLTTIKDFYLDLGYFISLFCLNIALDNELIHSMKSRSLSLMLKAVFTLCVLFNLITLFMPNEWYTIFSKTNLYVLIAFVFSPLLGTLGLCLLKRAFKKHYVLV